MGCTHQHLHHQTPPQVRWVQPSLAAFDRIKVMGPFDLYVVSTHGPARARYAVRPNQTHPYLYVKEKTLYVLPNRAVCPDRISLYIRAANVNELDLDEGARLATQHFPSGKHFTLIDRSPGDLTLRGAFSITKIVKGAPGVIDIQWLHSPKLEVIASRGAYVRLAGFVDHFRAHLEDNSLLDAKHLRAKHAWVRTQDSSVAQVFAINILDAFASNNSLIDYYKAPKHLSEHVFDHANVTPIASWD